MLLLLFHFSLLPSPVPSPSPLYRPPPPRPPLPTHVSFPSACCSISPNNRSHRGMDLVLGSGNGPHPVINTSPSNQVVIINVYPPRKPKYFPPPPKHTPSPGRPEDKEKSAISHDVGGGRMPTRLCVGACRYSCNGICYTCNGTGEMLEGSHFHVILMLIIGQKQI